MVDKEALLVLAQNDKWQRLDLTTGSIIIPHDQGFKANPHLWFASWSPSLERESLFLNAGSRSGSVQSEQSSFLLMDTHILNTDELLLLLW